MNWRDHDDRMFEEWRQVQVARPEWLGRVQIRGGDVDCGISEAGEGINICATMVTANETVWLGRWKKTQSGDLRSWNAQRAAMSG